MLFESQPPTNKHTNKPLASKGHGPALSQLLIHLTTISYESTSKIDRFLVSLMYCDHMMLLVSLKYNKLMERNKFTHFIAYFLLLPTLKSV